MTYPPGMMRGSPRRCVGSIRTPIRSAEIALYRDSEESVSGRG